MRLRGELDALLRRGIDPLRPRGAAAGDRRRLRRADAGGGRRRGDTGARLTSAWHGFTLGGLERYTRTVGQVFSPAVTLIFTLKTLLLALAVS